MSHSLVFVLGSAPHGSSRAREGLDAVLAASAVCEDIVVFFEGDGVWQLLKDQSPTKIMQRNVLPTYGLLDLYEVEELFVDRQALRDRQLSIDHLAIKITEIDAKQFYLKHANAHAIVRF
jgi:tRNA 2-thiouridine synthesizing protein C